MAAKKDPASEPGYELGAEPGYEAARDALTEIVARLEAGNLTLEESLALWERGEKLAAVCRDRLDGARARLDAAIAKTAEEDQR
ncbi:exodeoxyribonuclease VII small subunit [Sporichthya polymorpha]|uniref:exodeoxyribonuclease VII small subunit n=1 Tax=Sporichthya polymorpha TaxID=35751 RepID=UPI00037C40EB|nr:exodeoxyribonuclease VII small subunit [Sporichthya polymorpha]